MGFRFRRSVKILPGVRVNVTQNGITSTSIGRRGASVNVNRRGVRTTVGIPGTGLSYSSYEAHNRQPRPKPKRKRPIILLSIAVFLIVLMAIFIN